MNVRRMCRVALMASLICIVSPLVIPVGPVPVSLATLAVGVASICLGEKDGTAAVAVYILVGAVGMPVFSGFTGGFQQLFGVTGGYFGGYIALAWIVGRIVDRRGEKWILPAIALGTTVCYLCGTAWFMACTEMKLQSALAACVIPFLPGDALKAAAAAALGKPLRRRLGAIR